MSGRPGLTNLTVRPTNCRCWWITHPCDGQPMLMQPVPDCPLASHAQAWRQYVGTWEVR